MKYFSENLDRKAFNRKFDKVVRTYATELDITDEEAADILMDNDEVFEYVDDETMDAYDIVDKLLSESKNADLPYLDEDEIIERIIIANDLDMDEIEEYGTDEYWIDNGIRNLQDLDSLYDDFIKDCDDEELKQIFKNQYL